MAALWRPLMVKFLILILTKSYFLVLRNNALTFVFFVIVIHELQGIVESEQGRGIFTQLQGSVESEPWQGQWGNGNVRVECVCQSIWEAVKQRPAFMK